MLQFLKIKNLALLPETELEFSNGFIAVTGETGAGKSVLLGALALLSGARAEKTLIGKNAETCEIEAVLDLSNYPFKQDLLQLASELHIPEPEADAIFILKRIIHKEKPQRILINGSLSTLQALQKLSKHWIDFHGPGEPQKLLHQDFQLHMLDLFCKIPSQLLAYKTHYTNWKNKLKEIDTLLSSEKLSEDEIIFYQAQIDLIDSLGSKPEQIEALESKYKLLQSAKELEADYSNIQRLFSAGNTALIQTLTLLVKKAEKIAHIDPSANELLERVKSLQIDALDIANEFENQANQLDTSTHSFESIESKLNKWLELKRKYGPSPEMVFHKRDLFHKRILNQTNLESNLQELKTAAAHLEKELTQVANEITASRTKTSKTLSSTITQHLHKLGFKHPAFTIQIEPTKTLTETGNSTVQFLFSANPGHDCLPLNLIASSGEMARVMLALKTILATNDATPLLVFDEVDANIGGEIAVNVAQELKALGNSHQVFCITHLPQVAAHADHHFLVTKHQSGNNTTVNISCLSSHNDQRAHELARMLGNSTASSALNHAKELLQTVN